MAPDRWRQVTEIFHAALARDAVARDAFMRDACQGDPALRNDVDALIAAHGDAGSFGTDPLFPEGGPRLTPGTRLGSYHIEDLLGVGGMGEVYRARDTLESKLFRAPYGSTDDDIYSLLSRSGILVDSSYSDHYNMFYDGKFIRMEAHILEYLKGSADAYRDLPKGELPVIISVNESIPIDEIGSLISSLRAAGCRFINASQLTGLSLTARG